jgi:hypothetical protein
MRHRTRASTFGSHSKLRYQAEPAGRDMEMTDSFHHRFQLYSQEVGGDLEVPETQHQTSFNTSCIKVESQEKKTALVPSSYSQ